MSEASEICPTTDPGDGSAPVDPVRAGFDARVREALALDQGDGLDRAYVFDALERGGVAFSLVLVTVRRAGDPARLEMVAIGGRSEPSAIPAHDFVRRARFPEPLLPSILADLIDRCGVEGALYHEIDLADADVDTGLATLLEALAPVSGPA